MTLWDMHSESNLIQELMKQREASSCNGLTRFNSAPSFLLSSLPECSIDHGAYQLSHLHSKTPYSVVDLHSLDDPISSWQEEEGEVVVSQLRTDQQVVQQLAIAEHEQYLAQLNSNKIVSPFGLIGTVDAKSDGSTACAASPIYQGSMESNNSAAEGCRRAFYRDGPENGRKLMMGNPSRSMQTAAIKCDLLRQISSPAKIFDDRAAETWSSNDQHKRRKRSRDIYKHSALDSEFSEGMLGGVDKDQTVLSENPDMQKNSSGDSFLWNTMLCQARAKRGCATHPRSIAERHRRTRISERIKKLQELVPNVDKHINTADLLEEAVEYVKYLQQKIQDLSQKG